MKRNGFTLVEIMITIALVALVTAIAIPSFTYIFRTSIDDFARHLATANREARDYAVLRDMLVRVRFDITNQAYIVETAPGTVLLPSDTEQKDEKKETDKDKEKKKSPFTPIKEISKDWKKIPSNLKLVAIISPRQKLPITEGEASIYYFSKSIADTVVLHIEDEDKTQRSISFHPINSKVKVLEGFVNEVQ